MTGDSATEAFPKIAEEHAELAELFREAAVAEGAAAVQAAADPRADPHRSDPRVAHEVGDLLFATVNVARLLHVDPELALREAGNRFERRITAAAALAAAGGHDWAALDLPDQEEYYQRAKGGETPGRAASRRRPLAPDLAAGGPCRPRSLFRPQWERCGCEAPPEDGFRRRMSCVIASGYAPAPRAGRSPDRGPRPRQADAGGPPQ